jgi:hypothetical protein
MGQRLKVISVNCFHLTKKTNKIPINLQIIRVADKRHKLKNGEQAIDIPLVILQEIARSKGLFLKVNNG